MELDELRVITPKIPERTWLRMKAVTALLNTEHRVFIAEAIEEKCNKEIKEKNLSL